MTIAYCEVLEEHPDNRRFLADCEAWFGQRIEVLGNDHYGRSIHRVFSQDNYLVGPGGARCTLKLKKTVREKLERPDDVQVFGYTAEELDRVDRFIDGNPRVRIKTPLIERNLGKGDCKEILRRAGIALPAMYAMGYANNNCVGCVKGGAGYWNKIRADFPEAFERMAQTEERMGRTVLRKDGRPLPLRILPPNAGRHDGGDDPGECGIFCLLAEKQMGSGVKPSDAT